MCDLPCTDVIEMPKWDFQKMAWATKDIILCPNCASESQPNFEEYIKIMNDLLKN